MISYIKRRVKDIRKYDTVIGTLGLLLSPLLIVASIVAPTLLDQVLLLLSGMICLAVFYIATFVRT